MREPLILRRSARRRLGPRLLLGALIGVAITVSIVAGGSGPARPVPTPVAPLLEHPGAGSTTDVARTLMASGTTLQLSVSASPRAICVSDSSACPARVAQTQVTLTATAVGTGSIAWPDVQVAFVIETTVYDGAAGADSGYSGCSPYCEQSNGIQFFVSHAQQIADAISRANPHTNVSFAMVDYFATITDHDDADGQEYHVDIPQFIPSASFGTEVQQTFQATQLGGGWAYADADADDNMLDSSMITAMYGTMIGSGLDWSAHTHHVIVWIGSTAPRDKGYLENYAVSPSDWNTGTSSGCEPSYGFDALSSPNCEGWIRPQDATSSDSIAQLAKTAPTCTDSIGRVCTIDMVDLYATPTDPYSPDWPCSPALQQEGGCPGGSAVRLNVAHVLLAGCDLAAATGGTWNGPEFFQCPQGTVGRLTPSFVGSNGTSPNKENPRLFDALRGIGFGPVVSDMVANGTGDPIFEFVPFGSFRPVPGQALVPTCQQANGLPFRRCGHVIDIENDSGVVAWGWNWSDQPRYNQIHLGDVWRVSFLVYAVGPPVGVVPVDASTAASCRPMGDGPVGGLFTRALYMPPTNDSIVRLSFPCALVDVQEIPGVAPPPTMLPTPPSVPLPFGVPVVPPTAILSGLGLAAPLSTGMISLQAVMAGFLGAGFIRLTAKNRPIATPVQLRQYRRRNLMLQRRPPRPAYPVGRFE